MAKPIFVLKFPYNTPKNALHHWRNAIHETTKIHEDYHVLYIVGTHQQTEVDFTILNTEMSEDEVGALINKEVLPKVMNHIDKLREEEKNEE
jgi:hypothetical protein